MTGIITFHFLSTVCEETLFFCRFLVSSCIRLTFWLRSRFFWHTRNCKLRDWVYNPGPRDFCSPRREYQATDKEAASLYFLSLHHFALRLSPFHRSSLRKPLASRVIVKAYPIKETWGTINLIKWSESWCESPTDRVTKSKSRQQKRKTDLEFSVSC